MLQEVLCAILGIPGTQVSVERLFSSLHLFLTPLRNRLKGIRIDTLCLLHNNIDILLTDNRLVGQIIAEMATKPKK